MTLRKWANIIAMGESLPGCVDLAGKRLLTDAGTAASHTMGGRGDFEGGGEGAARGREGQV